MVVTRREMSANRRGVPLANRGGLDFDKFTKQTPQKSQNTQKLHSRSFQSFSRGFSLD